MRSASRLSTAAPEAAVVNPGSSNITHEPVSSSFTLMFKFGLSVITLYSLSARTLVSPSAVNSLPLRLSTTGGPEGARLPLIRPPPGAIAKTGGAGGATGGAGGAARGAPAPGPPPPPKPTAPPPPPTVMRPTSPVHTAAFQSDLTSQCSSTLMASVPVMLTMYELGTPVMVPSLSLNTEVL